MNLLKIKTELITSIKTEDIIYIDILLRVNLGGLLCVLYK